VFAIVKRSTLNQMNECLANSEEQLNRINIDNEALIEENERTWKEIRDLLARLESLNEQEVVGNENSVTLTISDDFQTVTPYVKVNPDTHETMLQQGKINDSVASESVPFAMQLVLLDIAYDALDQVISAFSKDEGDDD